MSVRSRRRRGGGTVFYDEDRGRYVGQVSYLDEAGRRHRPKVYAKTAEACWEKLDELRRELKKSGSVAPRDLTVADVLADLLAHPPADWKSPLTRVNRKNHAARMSGLAGQGEAGPADPSSRWSGSLRKRRPRGSRLTPCVG